MGRTTLRLITGQGLKLTLAGLALGAAGAFALTRFMAPLLYGVTATDPLTFILISLALAGAALLACWIPARQATKVESDDRSSARMSRSHSASGATCECFPMA